MSLNTEQLNALIQHGESETLEFKKSTAKLHAVFETICGFLNNQGGVLLIGITDKGEFAGQDVTDNTKREIAHELAKIEPPAEIINYMMLENAKYIIIIEASSNHHAPYVYAGCPYEREQSTTRRMPQHRYDQLLLERNQFNFSWEKSEAEGYSLTDEALDNGMFFVRRHLPVAAKIVPWQLERVETPLIPYDAVREALINAFIHRDYNPQSSAIGLAIYDDRMEVFNDGGLLSGVTIEKIKAGFSKLRNPLIAQVLFRCNLIERWGRGIPDMAKSCLSSGDPIPELFSDNLEFRVTFPFPKSISPPVISLEGEGGINQLTLRQQKIYHLLNETGSVGLSPAELMSVLKNDIPERTLRRELKILEGLGLVESKGQTRTIRWYVTVKH